jgi:tetratricopeptide (TPR) repeat protein
LAALQKQTTDLSNQVDSLTRSKETLRNQLDTITQQATHAQWLLSVVLGTVGLLALVQGLFAFFSAQNYVKQAEDAINKAAEAVTAADAAVKEVQLKFPMFANFETARAEAFAELGRVRLALVDSDKNVYAKADPLTRQRIFAIESFSAMQFLTPASRGEELLDNLRLLGKFYAGKFSSDHLQVDFERSYYYFDLAVQISRRRFTALNDLGWLLPDEDKSRACFEESFRSNPNQQRALYCLGTIDCVKGDRNRLERAKDYLLKANKQPNWETAPVPAMSAHIDYNLACVYDSLAGLENDPVKKTELLDEAYGYLEQAAHFGAQPKELLENDLKTGEMVNLEGSAAHATRLGATKGVYEAAWRKNADA